MFFWTIKWSMISLLLIALIHYLFYFLQNILTVPKVRDVMHHNIYDLLLTQTHAMPQTHAIPQTHVAQIMAQDMQEELTKYLDEVKVN